MLKLRNKSVLIKL